MSPLLPNLQLLVFDARRGSQEGQQDKLLGCYPAVSESLQQSRLVGLLQGLAVFTATFAGVDTWDVVETDQALWTLLHAEPSVYFAVVAAKSWLPRHVTQDNLQGLLKHAHLLVQLIHGSVQLLLDQDESADLARRHIGHVLSHLGQQLSNTASWLHRELRNPLTVLGCVPTLHTSLPVSLAVQSFQNRLMLAALGGGVSVADVVVLHRSLLLWSTLAAKDTAAVYSLVATAFLQPSAANAASPDAPSLLKGESWQQLSNGLVVPCTSGCAVARVHLGSGSVVRRLVPFSEGKLLVLALMSEGPAGEAALLAAAHAAVAGPSKQLNEMLAEEMDQADPGHVPGCRYLSQGVGGCTVWASPRSKISAMTHHARALTTAVADSRSRGDTCLSAQPFTEVWVKSSNDVWVAARRNELAERQLLVVREKRTERTLSESLDRLDDIVDGLEAAL